MEYIKIQENGIYIVFGITEKRQLKLLHFSKNAFCEADLCKVGPECKVEDQVRKEQLIDEAFQLVQVSLSGYNRPYEKHGNKHIVTAPGYLLTYVGMEDSVNKIGRRLTITQEDREVTHVRVETVMQFYNGTSIVRMWNTVINEGTETQCLEYLSSFCYTGIEKEGEQNSDAKMRLRVPYNGWQKEINSYADQIEKWQDKLESQVDRYTKMFTRLETLMNQMNSQSSQLASLMGGQ